jgi:hypothetical protein
MASEHIPALANYLAHRAAPCIAEAIFHEQDGVDRDAVDEWFGRAIRGNVELQAVERILGRDFLDDQAQEAAQTVMGVMHEAMERTLEDQSVWYRRLTTQARQRLLSRLMDEVIGQWARAYGMDMAEVVRLRRKGGRR